MQTELVVILKRAARRLLFRRVLESAAVAITSAACCAAVVQVCLWLTPRAGAVVAALCGAMAVFGGATLAGGAVSRALHLDRLQSRFLGICCIVSAAVALAAWLGASLASRATPAWASWLIPAVWLAAGAAVGAGGAVKRGVTVLQAAVHMDIRGGLAERLSTAAELAAREQHQPRCAEAVYADALDAVAGRSTRKLLSWRRTRRTVGALGLALTLCAALAFLPDVTAGPARTVASLADLPAALASMTDRQMRSLMIRLRMLARNGNLPATTREALQAAAWAVNRRDAAALREVLERLARAIDTAGDDVRGRVMTEVAAALAGGGRQGPAPSGAAAAVPPDGGERLVGVYDPLYDKSGHLGRLAQPGDARGAADTAAGRTVAFDTAWRAACDRAEGSLTASAAPQPYRRIIRRFYALDGQAHDIQR